MKKSPSFLISLWLMAMICFGGTLKAQPPGTVSPIVTMNGYSLQKSTSLSSVKTNDPFTYTVTFSIPGGATSVVISDPVPAPLIIDNVITPIGGYSGIMPAVNTAGNLVTLSFSSVTSSISGSFQINVHFPVESSCNGLRVGNHATMTGKTPTADLSTELIFTTAIVNNPWRIQKYPTAPYISTCPYGTLSDTVEYNIRVVKQWWTVSGAASLYNISLFDILPLGATVLPLTYTCSANLSPSSISSSGLITLPGGFALNASANNVYTAKFKIVFSPPIPANSCVINTGVLQGKYNCNGTVSAVYADTSRVGIQKDSGIINASLSKWYSVSGNVPGCTGTFFVRVCNTGLTTIPGYVLTDNFPSACLTGVTIGPMPAVGCSVTGGPSVYSITGATLLPGQCHIYSFNFTIGIGCPGPITNTVSVVSGFTSPTRSSSIYLLPNNATPCLTKSICGPSSYTVGSIVRFRLRIQNIGGTPIIGGSIADNLDNGNLQYIGNELYYSYPNPFAPCAPSNTTPPMGATLWPGVNTAHNIPLGQLHWNIDTIKVECGNVPYPACGFAYGLRAYYIEFSVKIKDTTGLGNLLNQATISGGNIVTPVSGSVTFVVNGNLNYNVSKQVSADGGTTFSSAVSAGPSSIVQFKLISQNSGIPLVSPLIVDLLPRDNNGGIVPDNYIMSPASRGSVFDIRYNSFISSTHTIAPSGQYYSNADGITTYPELGFTVNANSPSWATSPPGNTLNIKTSFSQSIGILPLFAYVFDAKTSASATDGQVACNSFVLRPSAKYIINYLPFYVIQPSSPDAQTACVNIIKNPCCNPYEFDIPDVVCLGISQLFCVKDSCKQPGNIYKWDMGDGTPILYGNCVNHTFNAPGIYNVTVYWSNNCSDNRKEFTITVKDCPCDINVYYKVNTSGLTITADATGTTSSLPIVLYVWDFGDGSFGTGMVATHTYASPGIYIVKLSVHAIDQNGEVCKCVKECKTEIRVDYDSVDKFECGQPGNPLVLSNPQAKFSALRNNDIILKAAPNPFTDFLKVSVDFINNMKMSGAKNYHIELTNLNGTVLQSKLPADGNCILNTTGFASGSYFVMLKDNSGKIQSLKVVKLK